MSSNLYEVLGVSKNSSVDEIKKAYRKKAMKYHPDRNKGDKNAEKKFKEINEAYSVLSDSNKKKQYDTFGSTGGNPFGGAGAGGTGGFGGFEDIFGGGGRTSNAGGFEFNIEDLFGGMGGSQSHRTTSRTQTKKTSETLDFEKTYEVPIFDLILGCSIEVSGVYGKKVKLKIPKSTKSGVKFRIKGLGKKESGREGNLIVKIEALMPKNISDVDRVMLERIRDNVGY